jgi:hypothetical protein
LPALIEPDSFTAVALRVIFLTSLADKPSTGLSGQVADFVGKGFWLGDVQLLAVNASKQMHMFLDILSILISRVVISDDAKKTNNYFEFIFSSYCILNNPAIYIRFPNH